MTDKLFRQCLLWLLLIAVPLMGMSRWSGIDLRLSDWMYDNSAHAFPWRDNWFAAVVLHQWAKYLFMGIGAVVVGLLVAAVVRRSAWFSNSIRRRLAVVAASFVGVPLVTALMKSQSIHHCPWDLQRYGGFAPYLRLFDQLPAAVAKGHCFPAGHASSALWLAAFAVFWLPARPRFAGMVFALGLAPGLILGWVQQMRGAHFLTHTLWSGWIASLIILVAARFLYPAR